ncbi:MAG: chromosome segregation protein SMC, partial [Armatimonadetes bacterium]|nr:chromosome segregation protein SMC [Armatimonadota bacterium]
AGVRKYRVRRDEAQRRLEAARAELRRLNDIITELDAHIEPLRAEAEKARQYEQIDARLRQVELLLLAAEYMARQRRRGRLENERANAEQELESARERTASLEAQLQTLRRDAQAAAERLDELRSRCIELRQKLNAVRSQRDLSIERKSALEQQLQAWGEAGARAREQAEELAARQKALEAEAAELEAGLQTALASLQEAREGAAEAEEAYRKCIRERESRQRLVASLTERISRAQQEVVDLQASETDLAERILRLENQLRQTQQLAARLYSERAALATALEEARTQRQLAQQRLRAAHEQRQGASRRLEEHLAKIALVKQALAATRAIMETMAFEAEEGDALAEVMRAAEAGVLQGVLGPVASLMDTPEELVPAVAAALGEKARWLAVTDLAAAEAVIRFVQEKKLGAIGVIVLDALEGFVTPEQTDATLATLVRAPETAALVAQHLLGDTLLVGSLGEALEAVEHTGRPLRAATRDGELAAARGAELSTIGPNETSNSPVARARRLRQAQDKYQRLLEAEARLVAGEARLRNLLQEADAEVRAASARVSELQGAEAQLSAKLQSVEERVAAADAAVADTGTDLDNLKARLASIRQRMELARETAEGLREELAALAEVEDGQREQELAEHAAQKREQALAEEVRVAQLRQRLEASRRELERVREEAARWAKQAEEADRKVQDLTKALQETTEKLEQLPEVEPIEQRLASEEARLRAETERARQLEEQSRRVEAEIAQRRRQMDEAAATLHRAELALAREETQLAALVERLQDQYGTRPSELDGLLPQTFSRADAEREAEQLKAKIRELGLVNLGAPQELERLEARRSYLASQREDVEKARQDLLQLIEELDASAKEEFLKTFDEVARAFQHCFERLFGGGETRLELTNPDDPLEGGVEIMVRPPGKRWQNLLLLSGGEKALTATAFVFALLQVRPSPLCVLDEIDAALDAASTDRFIALLKDFAARSQFIIVTHNPQTVTAADMIYGVTMQTPGVSMVLAVELEEAQEMAREATRARAKLRIAPAT